MTSTAAAAATTTTAAATTPPPPPPPQFTQTHHQRRPNLHTLPPQTLKTLTPQLTTQFTKPSHSHEPIRYPLASSGRGFLIRPPLSDQILTMYPPRSVVGGYPPPPPPPPLMQQQQQHQGQAIRMVRGAYLNPSHASMAGPVSVGTAVKGAPFSVHPQPKVASPLISAPDCNGHKDSVSRGKDDSFATVRDRKVRISDGASIYALCRSWLRNGLPEDVRPQLGDTAKSLPRPSAIPPSESSSPKRKEPDEGDDKEDKDEKSVEDLSSQELLKRHIKRAKRVRARLREERMQRIVRYKSRLALLLPPSMEQSWNDAAPGT